MRYRTTIEVVAEAESRKEAMDIVDDYLAGNLVSGVDMRCKTRPVRSYGKAVISVTVVCAVIVIGAISMLRVDPSSKAISYAPAVSTVQPELKTQSRSISSSEFKKEWDNKQTSKALEIIKRTK
jgi:hypothetical protein